MALTKLVVGGVIVDDLGAPTRILAARRSNPPELRGLGEFPGGKVEDGEQPEDALRRELQEELGIHVVLGDELSPPKADAWHISDHLEMRLWFATIDRGVPEPAGSHDEIRWLDRDSFTSVDWLDADRLVLPLVFLS